MSVTVGAIRTRIRTQLKEATQRFYPDSAIAGLIGWYCDGAAEQHRVVLSMARDQDRLGELSHPYLRKFSKSLSINVVEGTQLYALPPDVLELWQVGICNAAGTNEQQAARETQSDDWMVRNLPQLQPTYDRPKWSLDIDPSDGIVKLKVIVFGNQTVPNAPLVARLYYFKEFPRIEDLNPNATVALDDPYNEGPVWYAVAQADIMRGGDGMPHLGMAQACAQNIMSPGASTQATAAASQARAGAQQVAAGESRDGR